MKEKPKQIYHRGAKIPGERIYRKKRKPTVSLLFVVFLLAILVVMQFVTPIIMERKIADKMGLETGQVNISSFPAIRLLWGDASTTSFTLTSGYAKATFIAHGVNLYTSEMTTDVEEIELAIDTKSISEGDFFNEFTVSEFDDGQLKIYGDFDMWGTNYAFIAIGGYTVANDKLVFDATGLEFKNDAFDKNLIADIEDALSIPLAFDMAEEGFTWTTATVNGDIIYLKGVLSDEK